ncbi:MAG: CRISPR-associated RAMP protein Csx10, partial [Candidatus Thorarchaeota archaeon]
MRSELFIALTPKGPLRTGGVKATGSYLDTLLYLPGSVLRGALAEWLSQSGQTQQIIPTVRRIRFGTLFPSCSEQVYALPFPLTALECKTKSGFLNVLRRDERKKGHGVRDTLFLALTYSELERLGARFPVPMTLRCRQCKGRMDRVSGFYARLDEGWIKIRPEPVIQTKVALSRRRRASQEGMLYRVIALRPKCVFVGRIWLEEESDLQTLKGAVENLGVGALTTRGFGKATLTEVEPPFPSLRERLERFNRRLKEAWRQLANLASQVGSQVPDEPGGTYFSVDLLSPAVLYDGRGLPTLKLELTLGGQRSEPVFFTT